MKKIDHEHEFDGKQDRNFYQKPFDEVTDPLPQIDDASASMSEKHNDHKPTNEEVHRSASETTDFVSEINEDDIRDQSDSTQDWDAEHSRTGRQK